MEKFPHFYVYLCCSQLAARDNCRKILSKLPIIRETVLLSKARMYWNSRIWISAEEIFVYSDMPRPSIRNFRTLR